MAGRLNQNALRFGTFQVTSDLRQAQERARSERYQYTVTFTAGAPSYTVTRSDNGYSRTVLRPAGVTAHTVTIVFYPYGRPNAAYTVNVTNSIGMASISVNAMGGISYQLP